MERRRKTAAVVDDDQGQSVLLSSLLEKTGLTVRTHAGAEQALASFSSDSRPDIIVTALQMRGMDGLRFCRLLRSREYQEMNDIPILAVSDVLSGENARTMSIEAGANAFVPAPFDFGRIEKAVSALLAGRKVPESTAALVVDDDETLCALARKAFSGVGWQVFGAHSAKEARSILGREFVDIVLLDYHLPDTRETSFLSEVRSLRPGIAVVMMTGDPSPEVSTQLLAAGAAAYVRKPFAPKYVVEVCRRALDQSFLPNIQDMLQRRTRELRESENKYRELVESLKDVIFSLDAGGAVTYMSPAVEALTGRGAEDTTGKPVLQFVHPQDIPLAEKTLQDVMAGRASQGEFRIVAKSGEARSVNCAALPVRDGNGATAGVRGRLTDITDRKQADLQKDSLLQADKMVTLGTMVAGVAHEINNPNNFIMLNSPILSDIWKSIIPILDEYQRANGDFVVGGLNYSMVRDEIPRLLSAIQEGSERIKRIVADLKRFARLEPTDLTKEIDINEVVRSAVTLVGNQVKKSTDHFSVEYGANLPRLRGSFQRMEQVVINLVANACEALTNRKQAVRVATGVAGEFVTIRVADEGRGIPENLISRLSDPFFTTKRESGGTGLGLSVSASIVKDHGGAISFTSAVGKGTVATVTLPLATA